MRERKFMKNRQIEEPTFKRICVCGWVGRDFESHQEDTIQEDQVHVETSELMKKLRIEGRA
jgi:hypothetical protein